MNIWIIGKGILPQQNRDFVSQNILIKLSLMQNQKMTPQVDHLHEGNFSLSAVSFSWISCQLWFYLMSLYGNINKESKGICDICDIWTMETLFLDDYLLCQKMVEMNKIIALRVFNLKPQTFGNPKSK